MALRGSIAIDLGTASTLIWVAGRGLVIDEPSAIALDVSTGKVAAVGEQADALAGKEPEDIEIIYPLRDGVIADLNATALMLNGFLRRAHRHPGTQTRARGRSGPGCRSARPSRCSVSAGSG